MKKSIISCLYETTTIPSIYSLFARSTVSSRTITSNERSKEQYPTREETRTADLSPDSDLTTGPLDPPPPDHDSGNTNFGWDPTLSPPKGPKDRTQPDRPPTPPLPAYQSSS